jgi:predicted Rossmann-fold nucleotide-binding protein
VLYGADYWSGLIAWLREHVEVVGNITADELDLVQIADDPQEVAQIVADCTSGRCGHPHHPPLTTSGL